MSNTIRIYVADLAAYNNGKLYGVWIDATQELDDMQEQVNQMLKASPEVFSEEYAIHDFEGFGSYRLGEYEGLKSAHEIACFIEKYLKFGAELLDYCSDLEEATRRENESYQGCYKSLDEYAEEFTEVTETEIPEHLAHYIDYAKMGHDYELSGDIFTLETSFEEIHVFWAH